MLTMCQKNFLRVEVESHWVKVVENVHKNCLTNPILKGCKGKEAMDYIFSIVRDKLNHDAEVKDAIKSKAKPAPEWRLIRV